MNAETRAKEIVDAENQFCEEHSLFVRGDTLDRLQAAIATAIRQAENDKLEEIAQHFEDIGLYCLPLKDAEGIAADLREHGHPMVDESKLSERIRSLKSKD